MLFSVWEHGNSAVKESFINKGLMIMQPHSPSPNLIYVTIDSHRLGNNMGAINMSLVNRVCLTGKEGAILGHIFIYSNDL